MMEAACSSDTLAPPTKFYVATNQKTTVLKWRDAGRIIVRGMQQKPQLKGDLDHLPFQSWYFRNKPRGTEGHSPALLTSFSRTLHEMPVAPRVVSNRRIAIVFTST
jgi:hypothetical protein